MARQRKPKAEKALKRKSCLLCRIKKLKCDFDSNHLYLNNGEINPCGNCLIYKAKCEPFGGSNDRSLIKYLTPDEYSELIKEREKLRETENDNVNKNSPTTHIAGTPDKNYILNLNALNQMGATKNVIDEKTTFVPQSENLSTSTKTKISRYMTNSAVVMTEEDILKQKESINVLKTKLNELSQFIQSQKTFGGSLSNLIRSLEDEILIKENNLKNVKTQHNYMKDFIEWDTEKLRDIVSKESYDKSNSMQTTVPIDTFDILKGSKKPYKRKIQEVNDEKYKNVNHSVESQLLKFSGFQEICLNSLLSFDIDTSTGEIILNAKEPYWYNKDTSLKSLPTFFGEYNVDGFISKPGLETVMREIISKNPNFEILSERDLKATLFLVLKFVQYHLSCGNMTSDIYTDPFEYFGNDLIKELNSASNTSDKVLLLYSRLPTSLINETLKKYPKFKDTHKNFNKIVNESSFASSLFQYFIVLTSVNQENFRPHALDFFLEGDNTKSNTQYLNSMKYLEIEDILLINSIHFSEKSKFSSVESLDYIESILIKFEQQFSFVNKNVFCEILSSFVRCVLEIELHKFESYLDLDEATAEKRRKLFWKAVYWDVKLQIGFGNAAFININHVTALLPKFFIKAGVVSIGDLKYFLLNKGFSVIADSSLNIDDKLEILNVSCSIITSDFMNSVLFCSDYTSLVSLLKVDPSVSNNRLKCLLEKIEYYNRFNTIFKMIISNVYKMLMAKGNYSNSIEYETLIQMKYLMTASYMRSYILTSSLSLISRLQKTCTDPKILETSKKTIDLFSELVLNNEVSTLSIAVLAGKSIMSLRSIDVISKSYSSIITTASSYSKNISTDLLLITIRVHNLLRLCYQKLIKKDIYNGKNTIHRIHSFVNLFSYKIRLCSRIVSQLFMAQQGINLEKLKELIGSLPDFVTDKECLKEELDSIFDTTFFEHDSIADMQLARNKKRYDDIAKRFQKVGSDITRAASSKDLATKPPERKNIKLPKLSFLTNSINIESPGVFSFNSNLSSNISPQPIPKLGIPNSDILMKNFELSRNTSPQNLPSPSQMLQGFNKDQRAVSPSPQKFFQSSERLENNKEGMDQSITGASESSNSLISSSNGIFKRENMGNGRNMVERINVGTMEDFLTNKDVDNLFSSFWDGFNMD
ncbi:uncharacterized protein HGUI_01524 [Hanseniaspora guilliermondii]|uniref:Zn(2)-C6 fungal-type domain-containing protein n=1 Tax=Hanseniaspora guilliermondii TaxID=56406 RepID=A0A1L0B0K1_9ASCO|nr:uncharacterized protein HGUI_01524 [Hanseniaspora guilliermondii]